MPNTEDKKQHMTSEQSESRRPHGNSVGFVLMLIAVSVVTFATVAWYMYSRLSSQQELAIKSDTTDLALAGCGLYYGELQTEGADAGKYVGKLVTDPDTLSYMNDYDAVIGRNEDTAVFLCLTLSGANVKEGKDITVTLNRANKAEDDEDYIPTDETGFKYTETNKDKHWTTDKVSLYISNIITAQIMQIDTTGTSGSAALDMTDDDAVYQACKAADWSNQEVRSFITPIPTAEGSKTKLDSDAEKLNSLAFTLNGYTPLETGGDTAVFFLKLDYNQALIEVYLNDNLTQLSGRLNQTVTERFIGDISSITIDAK